MKTVERYTARWQIEVAETVVTGHDVAGTHYASYSGRCVARVEGGLTTHLQSDTIGTDV